MEQLEIDERDGRIYSIGKKKKSMTIPESLVTHRILVIIVQKICVANVARKVGNGQIT